MDQRLSTAVRVAALGLATITFSLSPPLGPPQAQAAEKPIKNLILVIGDGMGPQQIGLLALFAEALSRGEIPEAPGRPQQVVLPSVLRSSKIGIVLPTADGALVADSACAATALATGEAVPPEQVALDAGGKKHTTLLERAREFGLATGIITDTRITHATPAAFFAHQLQRARENEIALDLLASKVDLAFGGGLRHFVPKDVNIPGSDSHKRVGALNHKAFPVESKRFDNLDLLAMAQKQGYNLVFERANLASLHLPVLGLFSSSGMVDGIAESRELTQQSRRYPTLAEMTTAALRALEPDPEGFFLMVEAGQIDWAGHANDVGTLLHEMLRFDRALEAILTWMKNREDTLLVITADHETGSFGFSYSAHNIPEPRPISSGPFQGELLGPRYNFIEPSVLGSIFRQSRSMRSMLLEFSGRGAAERTPASLAKLLSQGLPIPITEEEASLVLQRHPNRFQRPGHETLSVATFPKINDFTAFYPDPDDAQSAIIARILAARWGVVWGTGSHTSTPVSVMAYGPEHHAGKFGGFFRQWELGRLLGQVLFEGRKAPQ